jgi:hypothetical protein
MEGGEFPPAVGDSEEELMELGGLHVGENATKTHMPSK